MITTCDKCGGLKADAGETYAGKPCHCSVESPQTLPHSWFRFVLMVEDTPRNRPLLKQIAEGIKNCVPGTDGKAIVKVEQVHVTLMDLKKPVDTSPKSE